MFGNNRYFQVIILILFIYSAGSTIFIMSKSSSVRGNSEENVVQINQLNAQIASLKIELEKSKKDNDNLKVIRELMEKERAEKDLAQKRHKESLSGLGKRFETYDDIDFSTPDITY